SELDPAVAVGQGHQPARFRTLSRGDRGIEPDRRAGRRVAEELRLMSRPAPQLADERGISLIEVIMGVAITVRIAGAMAVGLVQNNDSALATQRQAQLVSVLQDRIEWVHQLLSEDYASTGFASVALSSGPSKGEQSSLPTNPPDPNDFIADYNASWN